MPPQRPRNHELETLSERAFENALPASFVVRPLSSDYGIDREVELFDGSDATGLTFKVQLKGTDGPGLSHKVRRISLDYWLSLDVPVLIVSYAAQSDTLRGTWAHSVGFEKPLHGSKTVTVHMDPAITFASDWFDALADGLAVIRALRRGEFPRQIPVSVEAPAGVGQPDLVIAEVIARAAAGGIPLELVLPEVLSVKLDFLDDGLRVSLPLRTGSITVRGLNWRPSSKYAADNVLVVIASAVALVNTQVARDLALTSSVDADAWACTEVCERLVPALTDATGADFLLALAARLMTDASPESRQAMAILDISLLRCISHASDEAFDAFSATCEKYANALEGTSAGHAKFNLAHHMKARKSFEPAREFLLAAATDDPRYLSDGLWNRSIAGCEWELGEFDSAANHYQSALDFGFVSEDLVPLLADSWLYAGEYALGLAAFTDWTPQSPIQDRFGLVRRAMLEHIVHVTGIRSQERDIQACDNVVRNELSDESDLAQVVQVMTTFDALNPNLWLRMCDQSEEDEVAQCALVAAGLIFSSPAAWAYAALYACASDADDTLPLAIMAQANFHCGVSFLTAMKEVLPTDPDPIADRITRLLAQALVTPAEPTPSTIRFVSDEGSPLVLQAHQVSLY